MKTRREFIQGVLAAGAVAAVIPDAQSSPLIVEEWEREWERWPVLKVKQFDLGREVGVLYGYRDDLQRQDVIRFANLNGSFEASEAYIGRPVGDLVKAIFRNDMSLVA